MSTDNVECQTAYAPSPSRLGTATPLLSPQYHQLHSWCDDRQPGVLAVADVMPDQVVVIEHSNGYLDNRDTPHVLAWLNKHHRGRQIGGVVAFGDWDAAWVYEELALRGATLAWLDSWGARRYGPQPAPAQMRAAAGPWARRVSIWWTGVQTASDAAKAISSRA